MNYDFFLKQGAHVQTILGLVIAVVEIFNVKSFFPMENVPVSKLETYQEKN